MKGPTPALDWLFERQHFGMQLGLERLQGLLADLGHPERLFRSVLVGGTNGKGSTAVHLAGMLQAHGQKTALFTSPHLTHVAERFVINGQALDLEQLEEATLQLRPHAERWDATFFEGLTALACLVFAREQTQWAVMEVGLGGRWDATNVLDPSLSIISSIGLDHTEILGGTLEAIAQEKAGILRAQRPAVLNVQPQLRPIFEQTGADIWALGKEFELQIRSLVWQGSAIHIGLKTQQTGLQLHTPLLGDHAAQNAALAAVAAWRLGVPAATIAQAAAQTRWAGRLEVIEVNTRGSTQRFLLDGAHNPDGAQALVRALRQLGVERLPIIFGASAEKDLQAVAQALLPIASEVVLTQATLSPRAALPQDLVPLFAELPVSCTNSPAQALAAVQDAPRVLVCGSLYLIGELRPLLLHEASKAEIWERWQ